MKMRPTEQNSEGRKRCSLPATQSMRIIKMVGRAKDLMVPTYLSPFSGSDHVRAFPF